MSQRDSQGGGDAPRGLGWVAETIFGVVGAFVTFMAIFFISLAVPYFITAAVLGGVLCAGFVLVFRRRLPFGICALVVALTGIFGLGPELSTMRDTDRSLARFEQEVCSQTLPDGVAIESCKGVLGRTSMGNQCDYQVRMVVHAVGVDTADLESFFDTFEVPHVSGEGRPGQDRYFEILRSQNGGVSAQFTAVPGFVDDWRCQ